MPIERPIAQFNDGLLNAIMIGDRLRSTALQQERYKAEQERQARLDAQEEEDREYNRTRQKRMDTYAEQGTLLDLMSKGAKLAEGGQVRQRSTVQTPQQRPNPLGGGLMDTMIPQTVDGWTDADPARTIDLPLTGAAIQVPTREEMDALDLLRGEQSLRAERRVKREADIEDRDAMLERFGMDVGGLTGQGPLRVMPGEADEIIKATTEREKATEANRKFKVPDGIADEYGIPRGTMIPLESLSKLTTMVNSGDKVNELMLAQKVARGNLPGATPEMKAAAVEAAATLDIAKSARRTEVPGVDIPLPPAVEAQRTRMNARNAQENGLSPQQFNQIQILARQLDSKPEVKNFNETALKYQQVQSILSKPQLGGPGDLALVFEFMKGLDPTSVVRESEYAAAAKSGNIFAGAFAKFNGYLKPEGGFLPPQVKTAFSTLLKDKLGSSAKQVKAITGDYARRIDVITKQQGTGGQYLTDYADLAGVSEDEAAQGAAGAPAVGAVVDGYRFKGGNHRDQKNWEAVK